jgi:hypothetical protein
MSFRTHTIVALLAVTAGLLAIAPSASAQYQYETPDGHQLVGPSEMPQQPSLNEEFGNATGKTVPNAAPDIPGVPGIQAGTAAATQSPTTKPGLIGAPPNQKGPAQNKNTAPQSTATTPGATAEPGSIVLPQGEASTVRVGPVEHITVAQRVLMGAWMVLLLVVLAVISVATYVNNRRDENLYQEGHEIDEGRRELHHSVT